MDKTTLLRQKSQQTHMITELQMHVNIYCCSFNKISNKKKFVAQKV